MRSHSQSGSVALVALCCVAVLGIALASFLAVSNQSMKLSNRGYAKDVSRHLAEMGLERALRSFNNDTYSSWTHPDATTSTKTIAITGNHYDDHFSTTEVKVRVDRYNATVWSAATTYEINDMVWYRGVWFHCKSSHANQVPPNTTYWTSAPAAWNADTNYNATDPDIVLYGGSAYRCILAHANQVPPNTTYWTSAYSVATWNAATSYSANDVALFGGTAYRCISAHTNQSPPNLTYWISAPVIYSEGVATLADSGSAPIKTQLHATVVPAPLFPNALGATTQVYLASSGTVDSYNSIVGAYGGANVGNSAVLAGGDTTATAVSVTSARVNGYVAAPSSATAPHAPLWNYGGSAILTATPAPTVPSPRVDLTRVSRSPNIPQFEIQSVTGAGNLPNGTTYMPDNGYSLGVAPIAGTMSTPLVYNITRSYTGGSYYSGLYLAEAADILTINGPVILNITGSYFGMGAGKIQINPGGSLEIYFSTSTQMYFGLSAGGGIDNQTNDPSKVLIATNHTSNTVNYHYFFYNAGALPFTGTIYMPNAYLTVSSNVALYGAISAKNIRFSSSATVHYDTSLRTASRLTTNGGVDAPYMISEWRELTDPNERAVLP